MATDAYQVEIELAKNADMPDIVKQLEALRDDKICKRDGLS